MTFGAFSYLCILPFLAREFTVSHCHVNFHINIFRICTSMCVVISPVRLESVQFPLLRKLDGRRHGACSEQQELRRHDHTDNSLAWHEDSNGAVKVMLLLYMPKLRLPLLWQRTGICFCHRKLLLVEVVVGIS